MGVSKINYGPRTVMDLSKDTVTASKLLKGVTAHDKNGDQITGTYEGDGSGGTEIDKTGNGAYAWAKYSELIDYVETKKSTGSSNRPSGFDYTQEYTSRTITSDGYYNLKSGGISLDKLYLPTNSENGKAKKIAYKPYGYNTQYQIWTLSDEKRATGKKGTDLLGYISSDSSDSYQNAGVQDGVYYLAVSAPDVNAIASKMLENTVACGPDGKVTGTIKRLTAQTITPGTEDQNIDAGVYLSGKQTIKGDANLLAENIKEGVELFGITGTYTGGDTVNVAENTVDPSESHTKLESLSVDGNCYFDTEILPDQNTNTEAKLYIKSGTTYICGARDDKYKYGYTVTDNFYAIRGSVSSAAKNTAFWEDVWTIKQNGATTTFGNNSVTLDNAGNFALTSPFYIGCMSKNGEAAGAGLKGKIYYAKIYSGSELVADMIPVKKADGTLCLYDEIRKKYLYNKGSGAVTELK